MQLQRLIRQTSFQKKKNMEIARILGNDLQFSRIGLGTWAMGGWMWGGTDENESIRTIHSALDRGITLIDGIIFQTSAENTKIEDDLAERGLPTREQEAHSTFSEGLLSCGGRAFVQSKRVRVVSMATKMRSSRSATARRARP